MSEISKLEQSLSVKKIDHEKWLRKTLLNYKSRIWIIEDEKRKCEKDSNFGEDFIRLSRDIHFLNDTRAKIKLDINNHTGSKIKENKENTIY